MSSPTTPSCVETRTSILLYTDAGAGQESIRHTMEQLKAHVDLTQYTIIPILSSYILEEWDEQAQAKTALLIIPGGADLPYCAELFGAGCDRIRSYVAAGGAYMGLCAGAYFGTNYCQFEKGHQYLEVCGPRELAFFPGRAVGCTFPGFDYRSQRGARATPIAFRTDLTSDEWQSARIYYNGGCHFIPDNSDEMPIPPQHIVKSDDTTNPTETSTNPTTIATTTTASTSTSESPCESTSPSTCSSSSTPFTVLGWYTDISPVVPAIILSQFGSGRALLSGVHPEFAAPALSRVDVDTEHPQEHPCKKILLPEEKGRITLWRSMLQQCGIRLN